MKKKVYVLKTTHLDRIAAKVVEMLARVTGVETCGQRILLKPNAVGPYPPSAGVTTSPPLIQALCDALPERGYEILVGDCPGESSGTTEEIFVKTGIFAASGKRFINLGQQAQQVVFPCRKSGLVAIAKAVLDADVVVSLAKLKTSCYMMFSGAVKNNYGIIPGTQKAKIHNEFPGRDDFADMLIDLAAIPKKLVAVIDGSTVMDGNGPVHGHIRTENIYIISEDVFAADYAVAQLLGLKINEVPVLKQAQKRGLFFPEEVEMESEASLPLANIQLPITLSSYQHETSAAVADEKVEHIASIKMVVDQNRCTCCGHCTRVCPVQAMQMTPYPTIQHAKCIRCYCCNELCQVGAIAPAEDIKKLWDNIMGGEATPSDKE